MLAMFLQSVLGPGDRWISFGQGRPRGGSWRALFWSAAATAALLSGSAGAQDAVVNQMYGSGVHAYFAGDYANACQDLTAVIRQGSRDPRCYYYRGLALLSLGRDADARLDFAKGGELEATAQEEFYDVSKALERIQGRARLTLEAYRTGAKMAALERAEQIRKARYEEFRTEQRRVLIQPADETPAPRGAGPVRGDEKVTADDPFTTGPIEEHSALEVAVDAPPVAVPNAPLVVQPPPKAGAAKRAGAATATTAKKSGGPRAVTGASGKRATPGKQNGTAATKHAEATDQPFADKPAAAHKPAVKKASATRRPAAASKQTDKGNPFGE